MSVTKSIKIKTGTDTFDARDIGAEAQYIDVSRDSSNDIIEDITEPGVEVATTEGLASTLKNIEANKQDKLPDYDTTPTQNSTNLVTSGGVYTAIQADSALSPTSTKPVQNKVVSNALDNKLNKNNISTVEAINGTAVGSYAPGDIFVANNGNTYAATATITGGSTTIAVGTNCVLKTISQTFQRVDDDVDSVKQALSNEVNARATLGAHNILSMFPSGTLAGVDFTTSTDGSVLVNGTASDTVNYQTALFKPYDLPMSGDYVLSGCPSGGGASSYQLWIWDYTLNIAVANVDTGNGATVTLDRTHEYGVRIRIQNGYAISNKMFYPMLRLATDTDSTYQPYAMTNQQLTMKREATAVSGINIVYNDQQCTLCFNNANLGSVGSSWVSVVTISKKPANVISFPILNANHLFILLIDRNGSVDIKSINEESYSITSLSTQLTFMLI